MMKNIQYIFKVCLTLMIGGIVISSCRKNLPDERLSIANDSQYTQYLYQPVLGRNTLFANNFQYGNSSRPLDFKIVNMRTFNGEPAPELTTNYPVTVWKTAYDGTEKSIAEIEAKRTTENHPLFEVRPHSGEFLMWAAANSNMVKAQPDSGYVFDVEMSNSGGRKYYQNFRLRPLRERPYEPSNLDPITGQGTSVSVNPTSLNITGMRGQPLNTRDDVQVLFKKAGNGNSITFKFVDTLSNPIDPNKFAATDWANLVHGFNMVKDATKVKYEVAYPIPCSAYPTKYTTLSGDQARVVFRFNRQSFGNVLQQCFLAFNFNIYQKGDWEITFWFKRDKPKFDND
ncbi:hypothetical protein OC25_13510 [Pedobacter kyungheensis]|uniref:DUF5007 domain-containing protein n=2 Tax=Pedobacter TaxID=84567 RepID=A0A1G6VRM1_9SPHI|nr:MULTISPECIES: DUF5007 domain-containing protein [Pedobacter]KIA93439.1 hypothetical protein OC25_13510 [Pedobacter kyungheensis]SDD55637.1 protein of unknown function [Pedobacter soli]